MKYPDLNQLAKLFFLSLEICLNKKKNKNNLTAAGGASKHFSTRT